MNVRLQKAAHEQLVKGNTGLFDQPWNQLFGKSVDNTEISRIKTINFDS
jgi:hypothetical protein